MLQVNFVGAIEFDKQRAVLLRRAVRVARPVHHDRGRDGRARRVRRRRELRRSRVGGFHPQFKPPPLPFPTPAAHRAQHPQRARRAHPRRGLLRRHHEHGAVRRARRAVLRLRGARRRGPLRLRRAVPVLAVPLHRRDLGVVLGEGVRRRAVSASDVDADARGPDAAGTRSGTGSISFLFFDIDVDFDITWGDERRHDAAADRGACRCSAAELGKRRTGAPLLPPGSNLLVSLRTARSGGGGASCCTRSACCGSASARVPLDLALDKVGSQKPSDANRFSLAVDGGGLAKTRDVARAVRAGAVPGPRRRRASCRSRRSSRGTAASSSSAPAPALRVRRGDQAGRPLRADHHRHEAAARASSRFFVYPAALFAHFLAGASVARSRALGAPRRRRRSRSRTTVTVAAETFAVALRSNNTAVPRRRGGLHQQARRARLRRRRRRGRPEPRRHAARDPAVRGGRMSHRSAPTRSCRGCGRASPTRSTPPTATRP